MASLVLMAAVKLPPQPAEDVVQEGAVTVAVAEKLVAVEVNTYELGFKAHVSGDGTLHCAATVPI